VDRAIDPVVDAVLPAIPLVGPQVQQLHRARMEGLYGHSQGSAPEESKQDLIKRMQGLYRRKRAGDAAARAEVVSLKERAGGGDAVAARQWQVYRAVALDDAARVERRSPIVGAMPPARRSGGAAPSAVSYGGNYRPGLRAAPVAPAQPPAPRVLAAPRYQGAGYVRGRSDAPHTQFQRSDVLKSADHVATNPAARSPLKSADRVATNPATGEREDD